MISDIGLRDRIRGGFSFLPQASSGFQEDFFRCASYARLEKGQYVCHEGTQCSHLALVLDGSARVYKLGESGREIALYRVEPGQSCMLTASCILSDLPFPAFAVTETAVEAAVVAAGAISGDCGDFGAISQRKVPVWAGMRNTQRQTGISTGPNGKER